MESPAVRVANQLAWELESRTSIELKVRTEILCDDPEWKPKDFTQYEEHYIETALGQRWCDTYLLKDGKIVGRSTAFSDGKRCAEVTYKDDHLDRQKFVVIKRTYPREEQADWMNRPAPINLLNVCREPLHVALPKAKSLGPDRVLDRDCDVFLFRGLRWRVPQDHVYYLDRATSIPLKVESYRDEVARDNGQPLWVWTAESLDQVQHHFIALKSRHVSTKPLTTSIQHVESVVFNKEYPSSAFWPVLQPGVTVLDTISNKNYKVPGGDRSNSDAEQQFSTASPVQAVPPQDYGSVASAVSLGLGLAVFSVGIILWWYRR